MLHPTGLLQSSTVSSQKSNPKKTKSSQETSEQKISSISNERIQSATHLENKKLSAAQWISIFPGYLFEKSSEEFLKLFPEGKELIKELCSTRPNVAFYILCYLAKSDQFTLEEGIVLLSEICKKAPKKSNLGLVAEVCYELSLKNKVKRAEKENDRSDPRKFILNFLNEHKIKNSKKFVESLSDEDESLAEELLQDENTTEELPHVSQSEDSKKFIESSDEESVVEKLQKNGSSQTENSEREQKLPKISPSQIFEKIHNSASIVSKPDISSKTIAQILKTQQDDQLLAMQTIESKFIEQIKLLNEKSKSNTIKELILQRLKAIGKFPSSLSLGSIELIDFPLIKLSQTRDCDTYISGWKLFEKILSLKIEHNSSISIENELNYFFKNSNNRKSNDQTKIELTKNISSFINKFLETFHYIIPLNTFVEIAKKNLLLKNSDHISSKHNAQIKQMCDLALKPITAAQSPSNPLSELEFLWPEISHPISPLEEETTIKYFRLVYKNIYSKFNLDESSNQKIFSYLCKKTETYLDKPDSDKISEKPDFNKIKEALVELLVLEFPLTHQLSEERKNELLSLIKKYPLSKKTIWKISLYLGEEISIFSKKDKQNVKKILHNLIDEILQTPFSYYKINKVFTVLKNSHHFDSSFGKLFENFVKMILKYTEKNSQEINSPEIVKGLISNLEHIVDCGELVHEKFKDVENEKQKHLLLESSIALFSLLNMTKIMRDKKAIFLKSARKIVDQLIFFNKTQIEQSKANKKFIEPNIVWCENILAILISQPLEKTSSSQEEIQEYTKIIVDLLQHVSDLEFNIKHDSIFKHLFSNLSSFATAFKGLENKETLKTALAYLEKICATEVPTLPTNPKEKLDGLLNEKILPHDSILKLYADLLLKFEKPIKEDAIKLFFNIILPKVFLSSTDFPFLKKMWKILLDATDNDFDALSLFIEYIPLIESYSSISINPQNFTLFYELLTEKILQTCKQELSADQKKIILPTIATLLNAYANGKIPVEMNSLSTAMFEKTFSNNDICSILEKIKPENEIKLIIHEQLLWIALDENRIPEEEYILKIETLWKDYFHLRFEKLTPEGQREFFNFFVERIGESKAVDGLQTIFKLYLYKKNPDLLKLNHIWNLIDEENNKTSPPGDLDKDILQFVLIVLRNYSKAEEIKTPKPEELLRQLILKKVQSYFAKNESLESRASLIQILLHYYPRDEFFKLPEIVRESTKELLEKFNEIYSFNQTCPEVYWYFKFLSINLNDFEALLKNPFDRDMKQGYLLAMQLLLSQSRGGIDQILYALSFFKYRQEIYHEHSFRETCKIFNDCLSALKIYSESKDIDRGKFIQALQVLTDEIFTTFKEQQTASQSFFPHFQAVLHLYTSFIIELERKNILDKKYTSGLLYDLFRLNTIQSANEYQINLFKKTNQIILNYISNDISDEKNYTEFLFQFIKTLYDSKQSSGIQIKLLEQLLSYIKEFPSDLPPSQIEDAVKQLNEIAQRIDVIKYPFSNEDEESKHILNLKSPPLKNIGSYPSKETIEITQSQDRERVIKSFEETIKVAKEKITLKKPHAPSVIIQPILNNILRFSPTDRTHEHFNQLRYLFWNFLKGFRLNIVDDRLDNYRWAKFWNIILSEKIYPNDQELLNFLTEDLSFFKTIFSAFNCFGEKISLLESILQKWINAYKQDVKPAFSLDSFFPDFLNWVELILHKLDSEGGISDSIREELSPLIPTMSDRLLKDLSDPYSLNIKKAKNAIKFLKICKFLKVPVDQKLEQINWKGIIALVLPRKFDLIEQEKDPVKKSSKEKKVFKYCCDLIDLSQFPNLNSHVLLHLQERSDSYNKEDFYNYQMWIKKYLSSIAYDLTAIENTCVLTALISDSTTILQTDAKHSLQMIDNLIYYFELLLKNTCANLTTEGKLLPISLFITKSLQILLISQFALDKSLQTQPTQNQINEANLNLLNFFKAIKNHYKDYPKCFYQVYYTFASIPNSDFNNLILEMETIEDNSNVQEEAFEELFHEFKNNLNSMTVKRLYYMLITAGKSKNEAILKKSFNLLNELTISNKLNVLSVSEISYLTEVKDYINFLLKEIGEKQPSETVQK